MTTYTAPTTPAEVAYYSKHKGELNAFTICAGCIQAIWGWYDFPAYNYVFETAFASMPNLLWAAPYLGFALLMVMHWFLRETYTVYWFDKMDNDPVTDSPVWIPIFLIVILFLAGRYGVKMSAEEKLQKPAEVAYVSVHAETDGYLARLKAEYNANVADINTTYDKQVAAATATAAENIAEWKAKKAVNFADKQWIETNIAKYRKQATTAAAPIEAERAQKLKEALEQHNTATKLQQSRREAAVAAVDTHNAQSTEKYQSDLTDISRYSWLVSLVFVLLYCGSTYRAVCISLRAGIRPVRDYTVFDQQGGVWGMFINNLHDALNRQLYRANIILHKYLTIGTEQLAQVDSSYHETSEGYIAQRLSGEGKPLQLAPPPPPPPTITARPPQTALSSPSYTEKYKGHTIKAAIDPDGFWQYTITDGNGRAFNSGRKYDSSAEATVAARDTVDATLKSAPVLISDIVSAPVRRPEPAMPPAPPSPPSNPLGSKSTGNVQVDELITDAYHIFQAILSSTGEDLDLHLDRINKVKGKLNRLGWTYTTNGNKIRFEPMPAPPAPSAPIDLYEAASVPQDATASNCDTVPFTVTQPKGASEQDAIDGWFKSLLTAIQREPSNLNNPSANKETVVRRIYDRCGEMRDGLRTGRIPNAALRGKAGEYLHNTVVPALRSNGFLTNGVEEVVEQLVKIDTEGEAGKA